MKKGVKKFLCTLMSVMAVYAFTLGFPGSMGGNVSIATASTLSEVNDTFDNEPTGTITTSSGWTITATYGTAAIEDYPGSGNKSLKLSDPDYDTANGYRTAVSAARKFAPISGRVVFETKMQFKKINHPNNNFQIGIGGNNNSKQVVRFLGYSTGAFGYADSGAGGNAYHYIPAASSGFTFPENEWVTIRITADTNTKTYDLAVISDSLKKYTGAMDSPGTLDKTTGTYTVTGRPFYLDNTVTGIDTATLSLDRFTGEYYFDYIRVVPKDSQAPTAPANLRETGKTETTISMEWDVSDDDFGVIGYGIYKGTELIDTVAGTAYTAVGLQAGGQYTFTVTAKDAQGNVSAASNELVSRTTIDRSILVQLLSSAVNLRDSAREGTDTGNFVPGTLDTLKAGLQGAIDEAQAAVDNNEAAQEQIYSAVTRLNAAIEAFESKRITNAAGDLNKDGRISLGDLGIAAGYHGENSLSTDWQLAKDADINGDGSIEIFDLTFISQRIVLN